MKATAQGGGLYRAPDGTFWERPWIDGRRTWRKVEAPNLKLARELLAARRTDQARADLQLARDPYGPGPVTVGALLDLWKDAGCPDRRFAPRTGLAHYTEVSRLTHLRDWWGNKRAESVITADCLDYGRWRRKLITRGDGGRTIDLELTTLSNVLHWAAAHGKIRSNPLAGPRPHFRGKVIRHCREFAPRSGAELHALARHFFETPGREVLGWQILLEAMTGCRTAEVLRLRWDAQHRDQPGFIEGDWLWISRAKRGVNPYVLIHPALRACLDACKRWHHHEHPDNPWYLPSPKMAGQTVDKHWLVHQLPLAGKLISDAHRTSHGLRAFYVTVRRSAGISDAQIAAEIGDVTGAAIIASTYGDIPANWSQHGGTAMNWEPGIDETSKQTIPPAWSALSLPENILPLTPGIKSGL